MHTAIDPLMALPTRRSLRHDLIVGAITGQVAGLVMAIALMVMFTLFLGKGPAYPVQVIGSFAFGDAALVGFHLPAFLTGLLLHQAGASLVWGLIFALVVNRFHPLRRGGYFAIAIGVGLLSEVLDVYVLVPAYMNARFGHNIWAENVPQFWDWTAHLIFGLSFVAFPWIYRRVFRNAPV